ncbi:hypothetical protein [Janthinobacterium sp. B9-8]|uniref:hypothetical protein n=1 Tax=Janthinobacterium sp. B9-8 TaxID=1236179 RepID=UPI00061D1C05|nr:hypothetical protein [Janthinobacterium sp. B9-8]AMC34226.1 hypothetical protein VN23_06265 [Janthinobacterium sp. B9-8]
MMSKNDVKGVVLAAIAGVAAMMIYEKVKGMKGPNLAPKTAQNAPPGRTGWIKETNGPPTWNL